MVVVWLVIGFVLLAFEMRHLAFYALFGAAGAFAASLVAVVAPDLVPLQVFAALVVATAGILLVRPMMGDRLVQAQGASPGRGVHGALVGEEVLTLDVVGDHHHPGHVRLAGERWLAVSGFDHPIPAGTRVLVTDVSGTTLVVWPVDGGDPYLDGLMSGPDPVPDPAPDNEERSS